MGHTWWVTLRILASFIRCSQGLAYGEVNGGAAWGPAEESDGKPQRGELGDVGARRPGHLKSVS